MLTEEIIEKARGLGLGFDITLQDGGAYLRDDVDTPEGEESHDVVWDRYCSIQEWLGEIGLHMPDACLEHDCITGFVEPKPEG
jgi:hypothetical protein